VVAVSLRVGRPAKAADTAPLIPARFGLVKGLAGSGAARIVVRGKTAHLRVEPIADAAAEPLNLTFSFRAPITTRHGRLQCILPVVGAAGVTVDLPGPLHGLTVVPSAPVEKAGGRVVIYAPACSALILRWQAEPVGEAAAPAWRVSCDTDVGLTTDSLAAKTQFTLNVLQGEVAAAKVALPKGAELRSVAGNDVASWELEGRTVAITLRKPTKSRARFTVVSRSIAKKDEVFTWEPAVVVGARHQSGHVYFRAAPGLLLRAVDRSGFERVSDGYAPDQAAGRQTLVLVYPRLPASLRLAVEPLRARVTAAVATLTELEHGVATQRAVVDYSIRDASVRELRVKVGEGTDVLEVACPGLLDHEVRGGVLTVRLRKAVEEKAQLKLVVQRLLQRVDGVLIPRLEALGVERQSCVVGVAAAENVELTHRRATEAEQLDVRRLPAWIRKAGPKLAYRYYDRPDTMVAVETAPLRPELDVAVAEVCTLHDEGWRRRTGWQITVARGEVFDLRLRVPQGVVPLNATAQAPAPPPAKPSKKKPAKPAWLDILKDWSFDDATRILRVELTAGQRKAIRLAASFAQTVAADQRAIELRGLALDGVRRYEGQLTVSSAAAIALRATRTADLDTRPAREGRLAFAQRAPAWEIDLAATPIEPVIDVQSVAVLGARPGQVAVDAVLTCTIRKAPINTLTLRLPEGAANSSVAGREIKSSKLDGLVWTVHLVRKVQGSLVLRVKYDYVVPAEGGTSLCGSIETPGAAHHQGFLVVARDSDRVELVVTPGEGLREIDPAAVPRRNAPPLNRPLITAHTFSDSGSLRLVTTVLGRADVLQAKALGAIVETVLKADGQAVSQLTCDIRNANRQFLQVDLPADATLLGAYVNSRPVSVATEPGGGTLVPLLAGSTGSRAEDAIEVSVIYAQRSAPLAGGRTVALSSPPFDVRTEALSWAVYLPQGYRAQSTEGNMELLARPPGDRAWGLALGMFDEEGRALARVWGWVRPHCFAILISLGVLVLLGVVVAIARKRLPAWLERRRAKAALRRKRKVIRSPLRKAATAVAAAAVFLVCLVVLAGLVLPMLSTAREEARRIRARNNLNQIAKAMATYLNEHGDNRFYPKSFAEIEGILNDQGVFYDPTSGKRAVYLHEGTHLRDDFPPNEPMVYMEGTGGVSVVFFDSHTEFYPYGSERLREMFPNRRFTRPGGESIVMEMRCPPQAMDDVSELDAALPKAASSARWGDRDPTSTASRSGDFRDKYGGHRGRALEVQKEELKKRMVEAERLVRHGNYEAAMKRLDEVVANGRKLPRTREVEELTRRATALVQKGLKDLKDEESREGEKLSQLVDDFDKTKLDYGQKKLLDRIKKRHAQRRPSVATPKPAPVKPTRGDDLNLIAEAEPDVSRPPKPPVVAADIEAPIEDVPMQPEPEGKPAGGEGPGTGGGKPKGDVAGDASWRRVEFQDARHRYAPVRGGRQKGALPITLELPSGQALPYIFHRPVTGGALGEIELDCRPVGSHRPAKGITLLGAVAFLGLVGVQLARRRREKRTSQETRR